MRVKGLHINSTAPFQIRNKGQEYRIEDFDLLCTILSALMWKKHNGPIKLYTDSVAYEYYKKYGLLELWDGGIDTETLEKIPESIDQGIFWAAAKLFAIRAEKAPFAMVDTDLIIWNDITKELDGQSVACLHREGFIDCYPPLEKLVKREGYVPDKDWDWNIYPCNTAFAYFSNDNFVKYYTDSAIEFMVGNNVPSEENISRMVFAEQRILGMCADARRLPVHAFLDDPFQEDNRTFTHLWGGKDVARNHPEQRRILCSSLVSKIRKEFPEFNPESHELKEIFEKYTIQ